MESTSKENVNVSNTIDSLAETFECERDRGKKN